MISIEGGGSLSFSSMGLFRTDEPWTHPVITVDSYELIHVLENDVLIYEGDARCRVAPGELLMLSPHREHGGYGEKNRGTTSFYWLHFYTPDITAWQLPVKRKMPADTEKELREILHFSLTDVRLAELELARFLIQASAERECGSRTAYELREYLRLNASRPLTVAEVAAHFGYSCDHLSRLYRREFGCDLKRGIVGARLRHIEALLLNTDYPLKTIAHMCGFGDENALVKFFGYHEGISPTSYRSRFFRVHRNAH